MYSEGERRALLLIRFPPSCARMYSELISAAIASGGPHAAKTSAVKLMRSVKKVALRLKEVRAQGARV